MSAGIGNATPAVITVAIATLDRPDALRRCLNSLVAGSRLPAEIIIVDQSRNDGTRQMVNELRQSPDFLRYVHRSERGMIGAQNEAFRLARSPIIAVTDDDCEPDREWIATLERRFCEDPELGAITGRILPLPPEGDRTYPVAVRSSTNPREFIDTAMPWDVGSGNNFTVKRDWLVRIGGCDERLGPGAPGRGAADMDIFYRLLRAGARIRYEPSVVVFHQRQSRTERTVRRFPYGFGMVVFCLIHLRQRDWFALRILLAWIVSRLRKVGVGIYRRDWQRAYEGLLSLGGGLRGVPFGLRVRDRPTPATRRTE